MAEKSLHVKLVKLDCYLTDENDSDEVFLKINGKKFWPEDKAYQSMDYGEYEINSLIKDIPADNWLSIELWDQDVISKNDKLGTFELFVDKVGGPFNTDMKPNPKESTKAKYNLTWKIISNAG